MNQMVLPTILAAAGEADVSSAITAGFGEITTVILVIIGSAFTLTALVVGAVAGIGWIRRIGKSH